MIAFVERPFVPSAAFAAARRPAPVRAEAPEPPGERGWFESSRELRDGLTVIELDAPALAAAFASCLQ
jgi:hypothetical protein